MSDLNISIIIPTYNDVKLLIYTIESILKSKMRIEHYEI